MNEHEKLAYLYATRGIPFDRFPDGSPLTMVLAHKYIHYARELDEPTERLKRFIKAFEEWNPHEQSSD